MLYVVVGLGLTVVLAVLRRKTVRAEGLEGEIALIQRIPLTGAPSRFVPIRFAANKRLSAPDKTMAAFEAIALAKALGTKTGTVRIVHGEKPAMVSVNAAALSRAVHRKVSQVASLPTTQPIARVATASRIAARDFGTVALRSIADPVALHSIERARALTGPSGPHGRVLEDASSWFESEGALDSDAPPSRQPFHDKRHLASPANA